MPDPAHWVVFLSATIVLLLVPGPTVMYVVARGVESGARAVLLSSVGFALGDLLQVLGVSAGLSAVLNSSPLLFGIVKYCGAAYLVVLGVRAIRRHQTSAMAPDGSASRVRSRTIVLQAFLALNPIPRTGSWRKECSAAWRGAAIAFGGRHGTSAAAP